MVTNRVRGWIVARPQRPSLSSALAVLLICGVLLLQAGCQQSSSDMKSSVVKAEQTPATPEKAVAVAPTVSRESPTWNVAQETAVQPKPQTAGGAPKIEFKATTQDLGDIGPESTRATKFEFKNVGNAPLRVVNVRGCCGSVTRGVKPGQEFAPGESGALEVEYRTGNYPGPLVRNISMNTNDPEQPVANLRIKANVVYRITYSPNGVSLFLKKDNAGCSPITLKSTDGQPFSIAAFRTTANTLTAEFDPNVKATRFVLKLKADVQKLARNTRGQIVIALTHPECKSVTIPYDMTPEFSVTPQQLTLFNIRANQPVQRDLWITNNYGEDFDIDSVSSVKGTMKVLESKKTPGAPKADATGDNSEKTAARYQLKIEITPPVQQDNRSTLSDALEVRIRGGERLTIQCRGIYAAS